MHHIMNIPTTRLLLFKQEYITEYHITIYNTNTYLTPSTFLLSNKSVGIMRRKNQVNHLLNTINESNKLLSDCSYFHLFQTKFKMPACLHNISPHIGMSSLQLTTFPIRYRIKRPSKTWSKKKITSSIPPGQKTFIQQ